MIKVIATIKKLRGISSTQFREYYENNHAPLISRLLPYHKDYTRNYIDRAVFENLSNQDYDVFTELTFSSKENYDTWITTLRNPEIIEQTREDEQNFLTQDATRLWAVKQFTNTTGDLIAD